MKVYYDLAFNSLVIEGVGQVFPSRSLEFVADAGLVEIRLKGEDRRLAGPAVYSTYVDKDGAGFPDEPSLLAYLTAEFAKDSGFPDFTTLPTLP